MSNEHEQGREKSTGSQLSRRMLITGAGAGAVGAIGLAATGGAAQADPPVPAGEPDWAATEEALLDIVRTMREDPEKYEAVRREVLDSGSSQEQIQELLQFATTERELAALMPADTQVAATVTTVTVTTILIPNSAY